MGVELTEELGKYECKYETLQETQTANFRVICEKLPVDLQLSKMRFWRDNGLIVREWKGTIQDLEKKTKIRRLISGLDAYNPNSNVNHIENRIKNMYENKNVKITIQEFTFKNQRSSYKNYVIELES